MVDRVDSEGGERSVELGDCKGQRGNFDRGPFSDTERERVIGVLKQVLERFPRARPLALIVHEREFENLALARLGEARRIQISG